jgi:hypothetical protein
VAIHQQDFSAGRERRHAAHPSQQKGAVTRAQIHDAPWCRPRCGSTHSPRHETGVAHQGIDAAQVAARADGPGIVGWQFVEQLGLETTFHHRSIR